MNASQRPITDRQLKAWLALGATDRSVGEGLTFIASKSAALNGKATWILRYRVNGRPKEKVLGRYPEISLRDAREQVRQDRVQIERGVDVAAVNQASQRAGLPVRAARRPGALPAWLTHLATALASCAITWAVAAWMCKP